MKNKGVFKNSGGTCTTDLACRFCGRTENEEEKYGEKLVDKESSLAVHYYCLILSSGLWQQGQEEEGFYGFLPDSVWKEVNRAARLPCYICKKKGASIGCSIKSCRRSFHYPCGTENQCVFQFFEQYASFCGEHRPVQLVRSKRKHTVCAVCLDAVIPKACYDVIKSPCCKHTWFHRHCLQKHALSAGLFFFKCAICNSKDTFQQEMLRVGIHIPERDASWELEENAFSELLQRHQYCDAEECLCEMGRKFCQSKSKWDIVRCYYCGSRGTHVTCSALGSTRRRWTCPECHAILKRRADIASSSTGIVPERKPGEGDNDIDIQHISTASSLSADSSGTESTSEMPKTERVPIYFTRSARRAAYRRRLDEPEMEVNSFFDIRMDTIGNEIPQVTYKKRRLCM
ncbi:G2/M phase-specific E3 ubiquitin-protein ligase-like [Protopterus annectens]|uniref:G2/M phase-specific E3 ubiquitin-protein ligase-like n=1 Tax=Protopterus annectens TaxID=7888 RepID=UPI001CF9A557|nr:G2/M phase-specific E3 ubiquitin-protein ligase-like [Protopterus annectens]